MSCDQSDRHGKCSFLCCRLFVRIIANYTIYIYYAISVHHARQTQNYLTLSTTSNQTIYIPTLTSVGSSTTATNTCISGIQRILLSDKDVLVQYAIKLLNLKRIVYNSIRANNRQCHRRQRLQGTETSAFPEFDDLRQDRGVFMVLYVLYHSCVCHGVFYT